MECIMEFLKDDYQGKLRKFAQGSSERHEETIASYKDIFIMHYNLVKSINSNCATCINSYCCDQIRSVLKDITNEDIENFFNCIRHIYLSWIDSDPIKAIDNFQNLLEKHNLLSSYTKPLTNTQVFFKARISNTVLTTWDMFHIPFNKRYLIGNQRYSLTGQPMLYIGSSVLDVAKEINVADINQLKVSVVKLPTDSLKIYDLPFNITDTYNNILAKFIIGDNSSTYKLSDFYKMILSSVCSFQKKSELNGYSFCEEYVIPQILALILKRNDFDGISYISTKQYNVNNSNNSYRENIAIFTKLNPNHVYDHDLYTKINITVPIDINKIDDISLSDLDELRKEINATHLQDKITRSEIIYNTYIDIYDKLEIGGQKYSESQFGKIHLYELYTVLNQILVAK